MSYFNYDGTAATESAAPKSNLYGSSAAETLTGSAGPDSLWGPGGDVMIGGAGDDTYYLQDNADRVVEQAGGGTDTVVAWKNTSLSHFADVENLRIDGGGIYGAGNGLNNVIKAGSGVEQLYGGGGQDVLVAGTGADTFIVVKGEGNDVIYGFKQATDVVRLNAGFTSFAQVQAAMSQVGADTRIDFGGGQGLILRGVQVGALSAVNFQLQLDTSRLGTMTFHDEFSGPLSLYDKESNPGGAWRPDYDLQGSQGAGSYTLPSNGELQIYTSPYFRDHNGDFAESPFVSNADGTLSIFARASSNSEIFGYHYTSGMISTKQSFAQTYGYFEMRAELPQASGGWPAFWLLPADRSWPPELDVMETLTGDPNLDHTTAHSQATGAHTSQALASYVPDTVSGFHTYGVLWTATDLTWYVDGVEVFHAPTPGDMNKPMYMIANLALGGWGGAVDSAQMPAEMKIDYIRAYQLGGSGAAPTPSAGSMTLTGVVGGSTLQGGAGDDSITGLAGSNYLRGAAGNDLIQGGSGFNDINGNQGDDTIVGRSQIGDWLVGGQGNDLITSHGTGDILYGNLGNDTLVGGAGAEILRGGQGDDSIVAGSGAEWISGDRGDDTIQAGAAADTFHIFSGAGIDRVLGFDAAKGDHVQLDPGTAYSVSQSGADTIIDLGGGERMILVDVQASGLPPGWIFGA